MSIKLVWNVFIKPETFEDRWNEMITEFDLSGNKWLNDMYVIRHQWVPAYFREIPMCCLMKTTSRCESQNSQFKVYSSEGNTLVEFMLCFEQALNAQRFTQRQLQYDTITTLPPMSTHLPFELHASHVYTKAIFKDIQEEIYECLYCCYRERIESFNEGNIHFVKHHDQNKNLVGEFKVTHNTSENSFSCSCRLYTQIGFH
ncbi:protein FAR1-RELATED SEQUENCE 1-like [Bidens hawaiensis]|uniref:protein FAR1-RELATED SEQUENCE 1-like n=1 Tax=Bidens hawaiensis TaxID=980011 RepID=UPI0040496ABD